MRLKRRLVNFLLVNCGLRHLHGSRAQTAVRAFLDEVDMQQLKDSQSALAFARRSDMYQYVQEEVIRGGPIDFIEFGVYRGESIIDWSTKNQHSESRFYGFDSFEGLPEAWRPSQGKGHFDCGGVIPIVADERVHFVKGWFERTVPDFMRSFVSRNRLVIHLDADLYGSTLLPLIWLTPVTRPGTLLIFDEFYDRDNEFKAFRDYSRVTRRETRVLCHAANYSQVCIEVLE